MILSEAGLWANYPSEGSLVWLGLTISYVRAGYLVMH
jgi:hypothetical protein